MIDNKWECAECKERPSEDKCAICNDYICDECGYWYNGKWVCQLCIAEPVEAEYDHEVQAELDDDYNERIAYIIDISK